MRPRHSDADLLELSREGSAPAFASLLHRHRDVIQRGALRAEHPERVAESAMAAAMRALRRGGADMDDPRAWLVTIVEDQAQRDPGRPGVERLLPADWFDRAWVQVERRWPSGRRRIVVPRWAVLLAAAVALGGVASGVTYLVVTADTTPEVLSELVAEPVEDPDALVVPGPAPEVVPEEPPELLGDVELGELPTYDLTGEHGGGNVERPTVGPPAAPGPADPGSAEGDTPDAPETDEGG